MVTSVDRVLGWSEAATGYWQAGWKQKKNAAAQLGGG